jgi:hypothetical protein
VVEEDMAIAYLTSLWGQSGMQIVSVIRIFRSQLNIWDLEKILNSNIFS